MECVSGMLSRGGVCPSMNSYSLVFSARWDLVCALVGEVKSEDMARFSRWIFGEFSKKAGVPSY